MSLSREQLIYLINTKGNGDWRNIHNITFNTLNPIYFHEYGIGVPGGSPGRGIDFVDIEIQNGESLCGFLITGLLPPTVRISNNDMAEAFMPVDIIDRIAFKVTPETLPPYVAPLS